MARIVSTEDDGFYPLPHLPRACAVTGRAEGRFIDFNVLIDRPEATHLYLDVGLIEEVAREHLGMVSAGKAKQLEEWHEHEKGRADELAEQNENLLDTIKTLRRLDGAVPMPAATERGS